jgi:hypothetical protein
LSMTTRWTIDESRVASWDSGCPPAVICHQRL